MKHDVPEGGLWLSIIALVEDPLGCWVDRIFVMMNPWGGGAIYTILLSTVFVNSHMNNLFQFFDSW